MLQPRIQGGRYARPQFLRANPPFGVDWKKQQREIEREHKSGELDRFQAGTPRVNDGSLLFVQHMISKFEPVRPVEQKHGTRMAVVLSGSPLFTGGAGSGESEIRKWIIENDWLEAIVALPEQMFYNTAIGTYVWIVTNRKELRREGKDGEPDQISEIVRLYGDFEEGPRSKIFDNEDFGYTRVTVERPLRLRYQMTIEDKARFLDAAPHLLDDIQTIDQVIGRAPLFDWNDVWARIQKTLRKRDSKWKASERKLFQSVFTVTDPECEPVSAGKNKGFEADSSLRDTENIPLKLDVDEYFETEVKPYVDDAWMHRSKDRIGYEINFNRYFYVYTPPRPLAEIDADLKRAEDEILRLLQQVTT